MLFISKEVKLLYDNISYYGTTKVTFFIESARKGNKSMTIIHNKEKAEYINEFREKIVAWGEENIRRFPWRYQKSRYRVLVSEFMLHRTQAQQVLPVYKSFIELYPSLRKFFSTYNKNVNDILMPLGLNWRIEGMLSALHNIWIQFHGVPRDFEKLMSVPGIGKYIAGATICFTQNIPITLIDTNIVRITGRVFGLSLQGEARRRKEMVDTIRCICDPINPRGFYYGLIDLAHLICFPKKPDCNLCPFVNLPCSFSCEITRVE